MGHLYVLFVVPLTWMAFAISDVRQLGIYFTKLFPFLSQTGHVMDRFDYVKYLSDYWPLFVLGIFFATPIPAAFYKVVGKKWIGNIAVAVILILGIYYLAVSTNNPFMYFNF